MNNLLEGDAEIDIISQDDTAIINENDDCSLSPKILPSSRFSSSSSFSRKRKLNLFHFGSEISPIKHKVLVTETQDMFGAHESQVKTRFLLKHF